jgi:hypothetical protein
LQSFFCLLSMTPYGASKEQASYGTARLTNQWAETSTESLRTDPAVWFCLTGEVAEHSRGGNL